MNSTTGFCITLHLLYNSVGLELFNIFRKYKKKTNKKQKQKTTFTSLMLDFDRVISMFYICFDWFNCTFIRATLVFYKDNRENEWYYVYTFKHIIERVSKIPVPQEQVYFPRQAGTVILLTTPMVHFYCLFYRYKVFDHIYI